MKARKERMERERLWTKALSQEFWAGAVTPLMFSISGGLIEERMARKGLRIAGLKQLERERFLRLFGGHVYLNAHTLGEVVRRIPSVFVTPEVLSFLPLTIREDLSRARVSILSPQTLRILCRLMTLDKHWSPFSNYKAFEKAAARIEKGTGIRCPMQEEEMSDSQLLERSRMLYQEMGDFLEVVTWGVVFAYIARPLTELLARKWGQDMEGELATCLQVGLDGIKTFEINREIEILADEVVSDPCLNQLFELPHGGSILAALRNEQKAKGFLKRFHAFQENNGHRFHGRDICQATWRERPETVIEMIKMNRGRDACRRTFASQKENRRQAETELNNRIKRSGVLGPLKGALFSLVLTLDRRYFVVRENMRYHADVYLEQFRRLYLEIGRRWQCRGMLKGSEDIVFLRREEIEEACQTPMDLVQTVDRRKRRYEQFCHLRTPEVIRDHTDTSTACSSSLVERVFLTGEVASPGRVTGPGRVIRDPKDLLECQKGDIVVAYHTDPSWTPVLSLAAGLVLEVGGLLSHGSIVAREYRIPALIQVEGAVETVRTGDRLELDTTRKLVRVAKDLLSP